MLFDRLNPFLGNPVLFETKKVYSPTVNEIADMGENFYRFKLVFATFDKEKIYQSILNVSDENYSEIEEFDDFEILTMNIPGNEHVLKIICESISFFVKEDVSFDRSTSSFLVGEAPIINQDNYKKFTRIVNVLNGLEEEKEVLKFKNDRVKQKYKKMMKQKQQQIKSDDGLSLKDMLSILCNVEGNGINIFNVGSLTMYQVCEHFERATIKENHKKTFALWANTYSLKEGAKLDEWMKKTKL